MPRKFDIDKLPAYPDLSWESSLWGKGVERVVGVDEVGRGSIAGPVAAAAVLLPVQEGLLSELEGVKDSKVMSPASRELYARRLKDIALDYAVGFSSNLEIDEMGILPSTKLAVTRALDQMTLEPQHLLIDYIELEECGIPQTSLVKGDARSVSIASASILAKTERDALMVNFASKYPGYGFERNKGYATRFHRAALSKMGPCPVHRMSFRVAGEPLGEFNCENGE